MLLRIVLCCRGHLTGVRKKCPTSVSWPKKSLTLSRRALYSMAPQPGQIWALVLDYTYLLSARFRTITDRSVRGEGDAVGMTRHYNKELRILMGNWPQQRQIRNSLV